MNELFNEQLLICAQACINSYRGDHGLVDDSIFDSVNYYEINSAEYLIGIKNKTAYICFRGTHGTHEWMEDLNAIKKHLYFFTKEDVEVHEGFLDHYTSMREHVLDKVNELHKNEITTFIITGHSLGGAMCTLCALDLNLMYSDKKSWDVDCVALASPRVGNKLFRRYFNKNVKTMYRFVYANDLVTKVPTLWMNFFHVKNKIWLDKPGIKDILLHPLRRMIGNPMDHYPQKYLAAMKALYSK